jgi:hypothetical protein
LFTTDNKLENEADVLGVNPLSLGSFFVEIFRRRVTNQLEQPLFSDATQQGIIKAQKIDQQSSKKHGITFTIGYILTALVELETC